MIHSPLLADIQDYYSGYWAGACTEKTLAVTNPADGSHLADVPRIGTEETEHAIEAAQRSLLTFAPIEERQRWLERIHDLLLENREDLARIVTLEHGKPIREANVEVEYSAKFFRFFASLLGDIRAHEIPGSTGSSRWHIHQRPAGVVGLITPWNLPLAMLAKKLAPAIGAGCGIVAKPARLTPLTAIALCAIIQRSGPPQGMVNLVIGSAGPIGDLFCRHPVVRVISFTGSTEVGKSLATTAAPHVKRLAMELGGNAPFIVFDDADLESAVDALLANKFRSAGQTCVCANRVYLQRNIAKPFTDAVVERVRMLRVGNGFDPETDIGPLINRAGFDKVATHVRNAIDHGATRLEGDDPPRPSEDWGCFYPPTVLSGVEPDMLVSREETFGPVIAISEFENESQVVDSANSTEYGLAAYVFTADEDRAERLATGLQFGHVGVNTGAGPSPEAPFGGMKHSGYGREGGLEGLLEFCEPQVVVTG